MRTRKVEFTPPAGVVPEGTAVGEDFDMVGTFRVKPGGTICLVMMGDTKMPGYSDEEKGQHMYEDEAGEMSRMSGSSYA